jgi:hypothetical protein
VPEPGTAVLILGGAAYVARRMKKKRLATRG